MAIETRVIRERLKEVGWYLAGHSRGHYIHRHAECRGIIILPRHRVVSTGVAQSIARKVGRGAIWKGR